MRVYLKNNCVVGGKCLRQIVTNAKTNMCINLCIHFKCAPEADPHTWESCWNGCIYVKSRGQGQECTNSVALAESALDNI